MSDKLAQTWKEARTLASSEPSTDVAAMISFQMDHTAALLRNVCGRANGVEGTRAHTMSSVLAHCPTNKKSVTLVASDGAIIVTRTLPLTSDEPSEKVEALIPGDAIKEHKPRKSELTHVTIGDGKVKFLDPAREREGSVKLIDGSYPQWEAVTPSKGRYWTISLTREILMKLLKSTDCGDFTFALRPEGWQDGAIPVRLNDDDGAGEGWALLMPCSDSFQESRGWADVNLKAGKWEPVPIDDVPLNK